MDTQHRYDYIAAYRRRGRSPRAAARLSAASRRAGRQDARRASAGGAA